MIARSIFNSSIRAATSRAMSSMVAISPSDLFSPSPRRSGAIHRYPRALKKSICSRHIDRLNGKPWRKTTVVLVGLLVLDMVPMRLLICCWQHQLYRLIVYANGHPRPIAIDELAFFDFG